MANYRLHNQASSWTGEVRLLPSFLPDLPSNTARRQAPTGTSQTPHEPSSFSIPTPIPHDHAFQSRRSHAQIFFPSLGHDRALIHLPFITSLGSVSGVPIPAHALAWLADFERSYR
jgi:hypothetical protein